MHVSHRVALLMSGLLLGCGNTVVVAASGGMSSEGSGGSVTLSSAAGTGGGMASSGSGVAGSATSNPTCAGAGNVAYFDGDPGDYILSGTDTVTKGAWSGTASPTLVQIHVDAAGGPWWDWAFESSMLPGSPALTTQNYPNTERWPFESAGHPGMDVSGNGAGCNMSTGEFQIEAITLSAGTLKVFTATFVQYCDGSPPLHGCVHFQQ